MTANLTLHLVDASGTRRTIPGRVGHSLMRAAVDARVDGIAADCGGSLTCATCHVIVDEAWGARLPQPDRDEQAMLDMTASPREAGSRLSCQLRLVPELDGMVVRLPDTQY
jgi:2Fe-2S ferredoxin